MTFKFVEMFSASIGEELSKKQAVQEGTIKKLRAQVREFEEEKGRLTSRLQVLSNREHEASLSSCVMDNAVEMSFVLGHVACSVVTSNKRYWNFLEGT